MSGNTIFNFVPSLYRRFFPAFFHLPVAPERHATCAQCAMVAVDDSPFHGTKHFFSERVKCCTFYPSTPNYLVGALLADISPQSKEGRGRFLHVIKKRIGVTPRGVLTPRRYTALYRLGLEAFGRAESMMCPFLDDAQGLCTVWDYRTALCSSYFCKFNHGQDGWLFWDEFKTYLQFTEQVLASYAMDQGGWDAHSILGMGTENQESLGAEDLDETAPDEEQYAAMWGDWVGREEEFYRRSHEIVRGVDQGTFESLGGLEHSLRLKTLLSRYSAMINPGVPDVLVRNPSLSGRPSADGRVLLQGYSPFDPRRVRKEIYDVLDRFDGTRPWRELAADIREEGGPALSESLVTLLSQHRILVEP
jgi:Fe-S-cluster containining protein